MIKILFGGVAVLVILVGLFFSFMIAELEDAPGMVIFGPTATLAGAACLYGLGEVVVSLRKNREILLDISQKLANRQ